jgi:hypothetical protein
MKTFDPLHEPICSECYQGRAGNGE